jgi:hypothetical protein
MDLGIHPRYFMKEIKRKKKNAFKKESLFFVSHIGMQFLIKFSLNFQTYFYRWDGHSDSLSSTLNQILPDVFPKTDAPPIPNNPPSFEEV